MTEPNPAEERWPDWVEWPLALYAHGGDRELSSKQWDDYKEPVGYVVPASQLAQAIAERDKLTEALTQLIYAIDLPSELGKIGSYTYLTAALQRLHGALSFARTALSTEEDSR